MVRLGALVAGGLLAVVPAGAAQAGTAVDAGAGATASTAPHGLLVTIGGAATVIIDGVVYLDIGGGVLVKAGCKACPA